MVPIISGQTPKPEVLEFRLSKVGFPIRKSMDQSLFAAPHGLSQRTTSFIASQRQGIHRIPLRHLIVLMIDARRALTRRHRTERPFRPWSLAETSTSCKADFAKLA